MWWLIACIVPARDIADLSTILVETPPVRTGAVEVEIQDTGWWPDPVASDSLTQAGMVVEIPLVVRDYMPIGLSIGGRYWASQWAWDDRVFWAHIIELPVEITTRHQLRSQGSTAPYLRGGLGYRGQLLLPSWWPKHIEHGVGGHVGGGLVIVRPRISLVLEGRLSLSIRQDLWTGGEMMTDGSMLTWTWHPGYASVSALAGIGF